MYHSQFWDALNEYIYCDFSLQFIVKDQTQILLYVSANYNEATKYPVFYKILNCVSHGNNKITEFQDVLNTTKKVKFNLT